MVGFGIHFPLTRFVVSLISDDPKRGFIIANICIVGFGIWCYFWPVRRRWPVATPIIWLWIVVETINGVGHPAWSILQGRYTPGVITAPILLVAALYAARLVTKHNED